MFCGTVNPLPDGTYGYLDEPGMHRRWWTIEINQKVDFLHDIDMREVWREVASWVADGEEHWLDQETISALANRNGQENVKRNPYDDLLPRYFQEGRKFEWQTVTDVVEACHKGRLPTNLQSARTQCGQAISRLEPRPRKKHAKAGTLWFLPVPLDEPRRLDEEGPGI